LTGGAFEKKKFEGTWKRFGGGNASLCRKTEVLSQEPGDTKQISLQRRRGPSERQMVWTRRERKLVQKKQLEEGLGCCRAGEGTNNVKGGEN